MENIHEIDLEKYYNWFFDIAGTVESSSLVLLAYQNKIIRYSDIVFYLTIREKEQKSLKHEVYKNLISKAMDIIKDIEKDINQLKEVLTRYSGRIGKALKYVLPNADERDFILSHRKVCFDVDLESFESNLKAKPLPRERIIRDFLGTRKYIHLDFYVGGEPLRNVQDNDDLRFKVLQDFAQDLATYDFIKYLNDELLEEQTEEIRISEKSLAYKIMLLHELGFFELNEINKNSSIRAKAEFVHIITGENFDNIRKCLSELDKPKDTKSNNPRKYEDEVKQKIKSLQRF